MCIIPSWIVLLRSSRTPGSQCHGSIRSEESNHIILLFILMVIFRLAARCYL